jgi:lauroyl/myristoyl acyltransferase
MNISDCALNQLKVHSTIISWVGIIIAALILAVLPYMLLRGPVNRIARMLKR